MVLKNSQLLQSSAYTFYASVSIGIDLIVSIAKLLLDLLALKKSQVSILDVQPKAMILPQSCYL